MTTMPVCPSCPNCAKPIEAAIRSQTTEPRNEKMIARYARGMMRDGTLDLHRPFRSTTPPPTTQPLRCPVGRPASPTPIDSGVDARSHLPCIHRAAKLDACHLHEPRCWPRQHRICHSDRGDPSAISEKWRRWASPERTLSRKRMPTPPVERIAVRVGECPPPPLPLPPITCPLKHRDLTRVIGVVLRQPM